LHNQEDALPQVSLKQGWQPPECTASSCNTMMARGLVHRNAGGQHTPHAASGAHHTPSDTIQRCTMLQCVCYCLCQRACVAAKVSTNVSMSATHS